LASIALGAKETSLTFMQLLDNNLNAGNLYTFSIAIIAASFTQYFVDFLVEEEVLFKKYKVLLGVISFFIIIFMTIFYSAHQLHSLEDLNTNNVNFIETNITLDSNQLSNPIISNTLKDENKIEESHSIDILQIVFYLISILISTYMFCVNFLKLDPDSYIEFDDQNILRLKKKSSKGTTDSQGTKV
jgi:hypothetical protein